MTDMIWYRGPKLCCSLHIQPNFPKPQAFNCKMVHIMSSESSFKQATSLKTLSLIIVSVASIIAAQRFTMPLLSSYSMLVPFFIAFLWFRSDTKLSNTLLLIALFFSIDHQVANFAVTPTPLRHLLYVAIFLSFLRDYKFTVKRLSYCVGILFFYFINTAIFWDNVDSNQLIRDVQILLLVIIFLTRTNGRYEIDIPFASLCILFFMLSELLNFFTFRDYWLIDYMSYDSTKYLIIVPSINLLIKGRAVPFFVVAIVTTIILIGYTSRTLMICYLSAITTAFLFIIIRNKKQKILLLFVGLVTALMLISFSNVGNELKNIKALSAFSKLSQFKELPIASALQDLDSTRFAEIKLLLDLPFYNIAFGKGFGSGIFDEQGYLDFVEVNDTAFSAKEIQNSYYFNFHDVWVDIGLRFGLLPLSLMLLGLMMLFRRSYANVKITAFMALVGLFSAFYSVAGVISIAAFLMSLDRDRRNV